MNSRASKDLRQSGLLDEILVPTVKELSEELGISVSINRAILLDIQRSIELDNEWSDLERRLHSVSHIKIAALYVYWISRLRPIRQIENDDAATDPQQNHLFINEYVALQIGLNILSLQSENIGHNENLDENLFKEIVRALHYKDLNKEAIYWMLKSLAVVTSATS